MYQSKNSQTDAITLDVTDESSVTYTLSGDDSSLFNIDNNGVIPLNSPDYENPDDSNSDNIYIFQ